ncbi:PAS domain-containing protein, partial [archaeon]
RGELTRYSQEALSQPGLLVITEDPPSTCTDCPLAASYGGQGAMTVRLEHGGKVYGLLSVSIPAELVTDEEEQALFEEVTGEIAFGLYDIELEEERERVEKALQVAAQQWRTTFDAIGDVICLLDVDGRILRCNKAMSTFLGKSFSDIFGHSCFELIYSSSEPIEGSLLVRMRETHHRETMVSPVGDCWFNVAVDPLLDENDNVMGAVYIMSDITDHKQAMERLLVYQQQLRSLASELSLTEERERRRIAADLHDEIGQTLAMINLKSGALREKLTSGDLTRQLDEIRELTKKAIQATRSLTFDLAPPVLYELGLEAGLDWLTEKIHDQHGILTEFEDDGKSKPLDDDVRVTLFRAVRELLINVVKHAHARRAKVSIWREGDEVRIVVEDNGVGFAPSELNTTGGRTRGFGLFNIHERLESLGGHVQLESAQARGTRVTLIQPLNPREGFLEG